MSNGGRLAPQFWTGGKTGAQKPRNILKTEFFGFCEQAYHARICQNGPPYQTCHGWFQRWRKEGAFDAMLLALAEDLRERGKLDLREAFIDGTFAPAKRGAVPLVKPSAAKAPKLWQWQMLLVFLSPFTWQARRLMK
jgi:hypothetical protein